MTEQESVSARLRRELLIEQGIERQLDAMVQRANATTALLEHNQRMEESQLRNLLSAAAESRSPEVVISYIRYQIGRNGSAWGIAGDSFGHAVIRDLNGELPRWRSDVETFIQRYADAPVLTDDHRRLMTIRLMLLYLGYLTRAFSYARKTKDFAGLKTISEAAKYRAHAGKEADNA